MTWRERGARNGAKRLPEALRRRVLRKYPTCWLNLPGICLVQSTQVHHKVDAADHGPDDPNPDREDNLVGVCEPCHTKHSASTSAKRSWSWKRKPEKHPGVLD